MEGIHFSSKKEEDPTINIGNNHSNIASTRSTSQNILAFSTDQASTSPVSPHHDGDCEAGHEALLHKDSGRERLKKHREEVAGRVMIPDTWGQEDSLKDWIDCSAFDELLAPNGISSARESLVAEGRKGSSPRLGIATSFWPRKHPAVSRRQCPGALHFMDYDIMLPSNASNSEIRFNLCDEGFAAAAVWNHF